jgi:hypothetical protein
MRSTVFRLAPVEKTGDGATRSSPPTGSLPGSDRGRLICNWWRAIAGVQVDLEHQNVEMDDRMSEWRGVYGAPATPIIAVAPIECIHGPLVLAEHQGLALLRTPICCGRWSSYAREAMTLPDNLVEMQPLKYDWRRVGHSYRSPEPAQG